MKQILKIMILCFSIQSIAQATAEGNAQKIKEINERSEEIKVQQTSDSLDKIQNAQYGDPNIATRNPNNIDTFSESSEIAGQSRHIDGEEPAKDLNEIHQSWLGKNSKYVIIGILFIGLIGFLANRKNK